MPKTYTKMLERFLLLYIKPDLVVRIMTGKPSL